MSEKHPQTTDTDRRAQTTTSCDHDDARPGRDRMGDVSHTNPYTDESMGSVFEHGVTVVADGGRREAVDGDDADREHTTRGDERRMAEVSHEPPEGGHGNRMFERVGDRTDVQG